MSQLNTVRIGIRGCAGLLGSRLMWAISRDPSLQLTVGILRDDDSLRELEAMLSIGGDGMRRILPQHIFLDGGSERRSELDCRPIGELDLNRTCDVVIDTAGGSEKFTPYESFAGPVIMQQGDFPRGRLFCPPFMEAERSERQRFYRQGGCIISGCIPVLAGFAEVLQHLQLMAVMQYDQAFRSPPITERIHSLYLRPRYADRYKLELGLLLSDVSFEILPVWQIPSIAYYPTTLILRCSGRIDLDQVKARLTFKRVRLLPQSIENATVLSLARTMNPDLPPILVFESGIRCEVEGECTRVILPIALHYVMVTCLPNLDAVRVLAQGMDPIAAMHKTDEVMNFR